MSFTDYFGQPIKEGDEIVYPTSSGTTRACFTRHTIEKIIPLVPHRSGRGLMRQDQSRVQSPSTYSDVADPSKAFVVQVRRPRYSWRSVDAKTQLYTIRFCENIIKVPDGA